MLQCHAGRSVNAHSDAAAKHDVSYKARGPRASNLRLDRHFLSFIACKLLHDSELIFSRNLNGAWRHATVRQ
jgi:hypothetical protein